MSDLKIDTGGGNVVDCTQVVEDVVMNHGDEIDAACWQRIRARIAELEADAKEARIMAWAIIRSAAGESWLTVPHHVVISVNDGCAIERHDDNGGYLFRAIDAARGGNAK